MAARTLAFYLCVGLGCALLALGALLTALVVAVAVGERGWGAAPGELLTGAPLSLLALASGGLLVWLSGRIRSVGPP